MREITLFCEDSFHEKFIGALVQRFAEEFGIDVTKRFLSSRGGLPQMHGELKEFLRDLERDRQPPPDSILVVTDANCKGYTERRGHLHDVATHYPDYQQLICYAIPDPHIERWMLVDPQAFKAVFGRGCTLPAVKCAKDEYKKLLRHEIRESGIEAPLGGEEFAEDIVKAMNLQKAEQAEASLGLFLRDLKALFNQFTAR